MSDTVFREARREDLEAIIALLADDPLGAGRQDASLPLDARYLEAFGAIDADPNQLLAVGDSDGAVVATLQLTFLPGLARFGALRGQIEAVRVHKSRRSEGLGEDLFRWAIETCRARGCTLVQLTSDKTRPDAHRFYARLGFTASHEGYKLAL